MRLWAIALIILLFNFSLTMMTSITDANGDKIFQADEYAMLKSSDYDRDALNETVQSLRAIDSGDIVSQTLGGISFLYQGFMSFVNTIVLSTIKFPLMLMAPPINLPPSIGAFILSGMVIVYIGGVIDLFIGQGRIEA